MNSGDPAGVTAAYKARDTSVIAVAVRAQLLLAGLQMSYAVGFRSALVRQRSSTPQARAHRGLRLYAASPVSTEGRVELPVQLHRLLQVNQAASRETCSRVLERLSNTPPAVGYSKVHRAAQCSAVALPVSLRTKQASP